jgi:sugar diacid utilization regulator
MVMPPSEPAKGAPDADLVLLATQQLYETTREICGRLDLEQALQAIVQRANSLLDGDVAYLATCDDEHRVMRMRAFDKVRSASFKALIVPYDVGIGGAVASQRRPMTVEDYYTAAGVLHTSEIDESAREEGLQSGVAAPVEFESKLLAVLFVAKRSAYKFSAHQITMLSSLANAAAIAINNAQVHGRLLAAMDVHQSLMDLALADRGPVEVTRTLAALIGGPALFLDWRGTVIADAPFEGVSLPAPHPEVLRDQDDRTEQDGTTSVPIRIDGLVEGFLLAAPGRDDRELADVAIEQTVTVLALELMKLRSAEQVELRLRGGFFSELLAYPPADEGLLLRQGHQLGCDLLEPHQVAVLRFLAPTPPGAAAQQPWQRLAQIMKATCRHANVDAMMVDRGDAIAVIACATDETAVQAAIQRGLEQARRADLPTVVAGLGCVANALEAYPRSFAEATRAVDVAGRLPTLGGLVRFQELGFHQVLLGASPTADLTSMAERVLKPLLDSDARRGTALVATVRAYLDVNGNVEATARLLGLHPNSIRGRVTRINTMLGRDLDDARTRLDLHLALETLLLSTGGGHVRRGTGTE